MSVSALSHGNPVEEFDGIEMTERMPVGQRRDADGFPFPFPCDC